MSKPPEKLPMRPIGEQKEERLPSLDLREMTSPPKHPFFKIKDENVAAIQQWFDTVVFPDIRERKWSCEPEVKDLFTTARSEVFTALNKNSSVGQLLDLRLKCHEIAEKLRVRDLSQMPEADKHSINQQRACLTHLIGEIEKSLPKSGYIPPLVPLYPSHNSTPAPKR